VEFVNASWINERLGGVTPLTIVDPRPPVKYLQGHIKGAVNLPSSKLFDKESLELVSDDQLAKIFGTSGIEPNTQVVIYDGYDGQGAAMLAWTLEYIGHSDVKILEIFFERWLKEGYEVSYRPVNPSPKKFYASPNRGIRTTFQDVVGNRSVKLFDLRSREEFLGREQETVYTQRGHLPKAISLPWTELLGENYEFLRPPQELERLIQTFGLVSKEDEVITYCRYGPRAAIGYLALQALGYKNVRVYDGSFHQWAELKSFPVEV
jgi:thiosulfate/3-mercaptopyruvate sulfurtransferase